MYVDRLQLDEFRLYHTLSLPLPPAGLRLYGGNASGKTSLLEAIYLLATMRSPRASLEREMINWSSNVDYGLAPFARVAARVVTLDGDHDLEVALTTEGARGAGVRKRPKLDGRPRRALDLVGLLKVVLFSPEDLSLVLGSPVVRRRQLDISISQIDPVYVRTLSRYTRLLAQRNTLLKDLQARGPLSPETIEGELAYWDSQIIVNGAYLVAARVRYVAGLREHAHRAFSNLSNDQASLDISYVNSIDLADGQVEQIRAMELDDAQRIVQRSFETAIRRRRQAELRRGVTLSGPHRDDIAFGIDGHDLAAYGSRGQQRLAVVATKLAELQQVLTLAGDTPVLLLDDVLSELDPIHRGRLVRLVADARCQLIITATERELLDDPALRSLPLAEARAGAIDVAG